jgi:hypothetical protein
MDFCCIVHTIVRLYYTYYIHILTSSILNRDLILVQHQYNNCTTTPHMRVGPSMWDPPSCEGLLYSCCIGVVNLTFSYLIKLFIYFSGIVIPRMNHIQRKSLLTCNLWVKWEVRCHVMGKWKFTRTRGNDWFNEVINNIISQLTWWHDCWIRWIKTR